MGMLLAPALHVALHELLGILLENLVDLVEELVDVFLDLLTLLGDLGIGGRTVAVVRRLARSGLSPLLLSHSTLRPGPDPFALRNSSPWEDPCNVFAVHSAGSAKLLAERQRLALVRGSQAFAVHALRRR